MRKPQRESYRAFVRWLYEQRNQQAIIADKAEAGNDAYQAGVESGKFRAYQEVTEYLKKHDTLYKELIMGKLVPPPVKKPAK